MRHSQHDGVGNTARLVGRDCKKYGPWRAVVPAPRGAGEKMGIRVKLAWLNQGIRICKACLLSFVCLAPSACKRDILETCSLLLFLLFLFPAWSISI
jgi:hypothetical protein